MGPQCIKTNTEHLYSCSHADNDPTLVVLLRTTGIFFDMSSFLVCLCVFEVKHAVCNWSESLFLTIRGAVWTQLTRPQFTACADCLLETRFKNCLFLKEISNISFILCWNQTSGSKWQMLRSVILDPDKGITIKDMHYLWTLEGKAWVWSIVDWVDWTGLAQFACITAQSVSISAWIRGSHHR